jgi:hypothetical protein
MADTIAEIIAAFVRQALFKGSIYLSDDRNTKSSLPHTLINIVVLKKDLKLYQQNGATVVIKRLMKTDIIIPGPAPGSLSLNPLYIKYLSLGEKSDLIHDTSPTNFEIGIKIGRKVIPIIGELNGY